MPVVMERPKMTRAMYDSLKNHILRRREKEKQEREELTQALEEKNRQEEERKRQIRNDQQSLEQVREEIKVKERELTDSKDQKHSLFQQLKKILERESEIKKKQQEKAEELMMSRMRESMMVQGMTGLHPPTAPYMTHPHQREHLTLLPAGMKRSHSPTSVTAISTTSSRVAMNPSLYSTHPYLEAGMGKPPPGAYPPYPPKPTLAPAKPSASISQSRGQPYPGYPMTSFTQQQKRQSPQHEQQARAMAAAMQHPHLFLQQQQQQAAAAVSEAARQQQRQLASSQAKLTLGGGAGGLPGQKSLGKERSSGRMSLGAPPTAGSLPYPSTFLPGASGAHRSYPQLTADDKYFNSMAAAVASSAGSAALQHPSSTSNLGGVPRAAYPQPRLLPPPNQQLKQLQGQPPPRFY